MREECPENRKESNNEKKGVRQFLISNEIMGEEFIFANNPHVFRAKKGTRSVLRVPSSINNQIEMVSILCGDLCFAKKMWGIL